MSVLDVSSASDRICKCKAVVRDLPGKGRGLVAAEFIAAGDDVLLERAVAWTPATPLSATDGGSIQIERRDSVKEDRENDIDLEGIEVAARLVVRILELGQATELAVLDPAPPDTGRPSHHPGFEAKQEELDHGCRCIREWTMVPGNTKSEELDATTDEDLARMLLVIMLNAHALQEPDGTRTLQGVFPLSAMTNHSCWPNSTHVACPAPPGMPATGSSEAAGEGPLWMRLRAVRDISEGEEITISYLHDLMMPLEERGELLRTKYFFDGAERRPCDDWLDAIVCSEEGQRERLPKIIACNRAADDAWSEAESRVAADKDRVSNRYKELRMTAATHYMGLLKAASGCLHDRHKWAHNARVRLASIMTSSGASRSAANALPLWRSAIECAEQAYPSNWPSHIPLLAGGCVSARAASEQKQGGVTGEESDRLMQSWDRRLEEVCKVLGRAKPAGPRMS